MTAATVAKVIGPCKHAPPRRLDPSRLEHGRERHSVLRENAVARSHTNSASLVHADVSGPINLPDNLAGATKRHMMSLSTWLWFLATPVS